MKESTVTETTRHDRKGAREPGRRETKIERAKDSEREHAGAETEVTMTNTATEPNE